MTPAGDPPDILERCREAWLLGAEAGAHDIDIRMGAVEASLWADSRKKAQGLIAWKAAVDASCQTEPAPAASASSSADAQGATQPLSSAFVNKPNKGHCAPGNPEGALTGRRPAQDFAD